VWHRERVASRSSTKNFQRLGYRRIVQLLVYLVIVPTVLLLFLGIVLMFLGEARINLLLGILTVSFVAVVGTGVVLVLVFIRREANLSELQADFVSKVSHELRTPLTAIRLFAETIERSRDDAATVDKCTTHLITECERLTGRIERLLDWGRMEAGRKLYELRSEDVADVVNEAVESFSPVRTLDVDLTTHVDPGLPKVLCDRHALIDAIVNLLSNAKKYGGSPAVVRLRARRGENEVVAIEVTDNGGGISLPEQRRIFDKFYRIDDRLSRAREGSGLGLAIVKHVVRAHGGRVTVDSELGTGSTFGLLIPMAPPEADSQGEVSTAARASR
jgi:two-component system, OmpR family, phosphate regulon sensor histidine kinase PhoR